ncbi:hypothetical protein [Speluncibacter jeojiensis]|uniref:Uncharacterized protein n=1 Tax=Speluncibacter jeojiensis TaxID=2710754 RepID=A0A9X4M0X3_9ACTN|nr:hypothetical protein [Corynebacteriales bacterium D3-21]
MSDAATRPDFLVHAADAEPTVPTWVPQWPEKPSYWAMLGVALLCGAAALTLGATIGSATSGEVGGVIGTGTLFLLFVCSLILCVGKLGFRWTRLSRSITRCRDDAHGDGLRVPTISGTNVVAAVALVAAGISGLTMAAVWFGSWGKSILPSAHDNRGAQSRWRSSAVSH